MAAPWEGHGGAVETSPPKRSLSLCQRGYSGERLQPAFSFSTASPSTGVLAPGHRPPPSPSDLNFAISHVPAWWWHPDVKMSLCCPVRPPHPANSSPDQRALAAFSASAEHLAQSPTPAGCGGFEGRLLMKRAPGNSVYPMAGFQPADGVESTPCSVTCWDGNTAEKRTCSACKELCGKVFSSSMEL